MQSSVNQIASMFRGNPAPLQQRVNQDMQANQGLPTDLKELLALQMLTDERESASRQQAMQQLQQTGQQPTVAQSLQQRAQQVIQANSVQEQKQQQGLQGLMQQMNTGVVPENTPQPPQQPQGIDQLPTELGEFYGGGIVAFADGGRPDEKYETPYDRMNRQNREEPGREVITLPEGTSQQEAALVQMQNPDAAVEVAGSGALLSDIGAGIKRAFTYSSDAEAAKARQAAPKMDNRALLNAADAGMRSAPPEAAMGKPDALAALGAAKPAISAPPAAPVATKPPAPVAPQGGLADAITPDVRAARQRMMIEAMNRDPAAMAQQMRDRYASEVGAPNTAGLEQLAQELQDKRAKMQERNRNIDPLVENLTAIANAPRGQKWMYSLLSGSDAVKKAQQGRETQDFDMLKQIVEQQNKIEDVKRGYRGQLFTLSEKERETVYKDAFSAAKELGLDDREAEKLAQAAILKREELANRLKEQELQNRGTLAVARERASGTAGGDKQQLAELKALLTGARTDLKTTFNKAERAKLQAKIAAYEAQIEKMAGLSTMGAAPGAGSPGGTPPDIQALMKKYGG